MWIRGKKQNHIHMNTKINPNNISFSVSNNAVPFDISFSNNAFRFGISAIAIGTIHYSTSCFFRHNHILFMGTKGLTTNSAPPSTNYAPSSSYWLISCYNVPMDSTLKSILVQILETLDSNVRVMLAIKGENSFVIAMEIRDSYTSAMIREFIIYCFRGMEGIVPLSVSISRRKGLNSLCADFLNLPNPLLWGVNNEELFIRGTAFQRKQRLALVAKQFISNPTDYSQENLKDPTDDQKDNSQ